MSFIPYESFKKKFKGSTFRPNKRPDGVTDLESKQFHEETSPLVNAVAEKNKVRSFRIEPQVAERLNLQEKEKRRIEISVEEEIQRRWVVAKEKAEVAGFTAGLEQGKQDAYQAELPKIREKLSKLDDLISELELSANKIYSQNESFLIGLVGTIAKSIVLKEIELDTKYISRLISELIEKVNDKSRIRILISKEDFDNTRELEKELKTQYSDLKTLNIDICEDMVKGDCRVESSSGAIEASMEKQIKNTINALYGSSEIVVDAVGEAES